MSVKVLGGRFKGLSLVVPRTGVRPSSGRLREALFSILGPEIEAACFLDLFAGTGAMGLEALSRGAKEAVFVDIDLRSVKKNVVALGLQGQVSLMRMEVPAALRRLARRGPQFDIIFADPPYAREAALSWPVMEEILRLDLLREGGRCFIEERSGVCAPETLASLKMRRYGSSALWEFSRCKTS